MFKKTKNLNFFSAGNLLAQQGIRPHGAVYFEIRINRKLLVAVISSLILHLALIFLFWHLLNKPEVRPLTATDNSLSVQLNPQVALIAPKTPAPVVPPQKAAAAPSHVTKRLKIHHPSYSKPILSALRPAPASPVKPEITPAAPPVPEASSDEAAPTDMTSYINMVRARKRAAEGIDNNAPTSAEDARDANIQNNLKPQGGGGIFQINRVGLNTAEFTFRGWDDNSFGNPSRQIIEVHTDGSEDIEHAIVRKMIAIIREKHHGDFIWESYRLNRDITLSARVKDNAGLESFMMQEFFYNSTHPTLQ